MEVVNQFNMEYPISSVWNDDLFPESRAPLCEDLHDCLERAAETSDEIGFCGNTSPGTDLSLTEDNYDNSYDFSTIQESPNNNGLDEILDGILIDDLNFGPVLVDNDITEMVNNYAYPSPEENKAPVIQSHSGTSSHADKFIVSADVSSSRRKQRIVPIDSRPFNGQYVIIKTTAETKYVPQVVKNDVDFDHGCMVEHQSCSKQNGIESTNHLRRPSDVMSDNADDVFNMNIDQDFSGTTNPPSKKRKRKLSVTEKRDRKRESNRNASYRYRQRKKQMMEEFQIQSNALKQNSEKEKMAYFNIVEEFLRFVKHANLINDLKMQTLLK